MLSVSAAVWMTRIPLHSLALQSHARPPTGLFPPLARRVAVALTDSRASKQSAATQGYNNSRDLAVRRSLVHVRVRRPPEQPSTVSSRSVQPASFSSRQPTSPSVIRQYNSTMPSVPALHPPTPYFPNPMKIPSISTMHSMLLPLYSEGPRQQLLAPRLARSSPRTTSSHPPQRFRPLIRGHHSVIQWLSTIARREAGPSPSRPGIHRHVAQPPSSS